MTVPCDEQAELAVAGSALATPAATRAALAAGVSAACFWRHDLARVWDACVATLDVDWPAMAGGPRATATRRAAIATLAGIDDRQADALAGCAVFVRHPGRWADRLVDTARRRNLMRQLADAYNRLADGATLDDVAPLAAALVLEAA